VSEAKANSKSLRSEPVRAIAAGVARDELFRPSRFGLAKRLVFLAAAGVVAGAVGVAALAISYWATTGPVVCGAGLCRGALPYRPLGLIAAGLLAAQLLWSRPDIAREGQGYVEELFRAAREATIAAVAVVLFAFFWRPGPIPHLFAYSRAVLIIDWLVMLLLASVVRTGVKRTLMALRCRGNNALRVAVIGNSPSAHSYIEAVTAQPETGYRIVAHLEDPGPTSDLAATLAELASVSPLGEVILATQSLDRRDIAQLIGSSALRRVKIRAIPEVFGLTPAKVQVTSVLGDFPLLSLYTEPLTRPQRLFKRTIDVAGSCMALLVTGPLLLLTALAVRLTTPGPVLFRQERIGMDGRPFDLLKFRSMYENSDTAPHQEYVTSMLANGDNDASQAGGLYKLAEDPRVTPVGRILRRLSIDELPQLVNVLRGEMSLVGPRPALAFEVELYEEWQRGRLQVRPGITGLWQVSGRSRLSTSDMLRLDVRYAEAWSPMLDLSIIAKTVPTLLRREAR